MRLILIRHGESEHALRQIIAENSCPGLTPRGFKQAELLAERLAVTWEVSECRALLCSPVRRAFETAEVLAGTLAVDSIVEDANLCELHPGDADSLSWEAYHSTYGAFDLAASPDRPFAPGAESWRAFIERVGMTLDQLAATFADQTVVVVTHAGFIVASALVLFGIPRPGTGARLDPEYTSLTEWRAVDHRWQLVRYNDTAHLSELGLNED